MSSDYNQRLLSAYRAHWEDLRLSYFNSQHPKAAAAWRQVEAEVGRSSAAVPPRAHLKQLLAGYRRSNDMAIREALAEIRAEMKKAERKREEEELEFALRVLELRRSQGLAKLKCIELAAQDLKEDNEYIQINFTSPKKLYQKMQGAVNCAKPTTKVTRAVMVYLHLFGKQHPIDQHRGPTNDRLTEQFLHILGARKEKTPEQPRAIAPEKVAPIIPTPELTPQASPFEALCGPQLPVKRELPFDESEYETPAPAKRSRLEPLRSETPLTSLPSIPPTPTTIQPVRAESAISTRRMITVKSEPVEEEEPEIQIVMQKIAGTEATPKTPSTGSNGFSGFEDLIYEFEEREIFGDVFPQVQAARRLLKSATHMDDLHKAARLFHFVYTEITSKPRRHLDRALEILAEVKQSFPSLA